jgi:hypothetical protein
MQAGYKAGRQMEDLSRIPDRIYDAERRITSGKLFKGV